MLKRAGQPKVWVWVRTAYGPPANCRQHQNQVARAVLARGSERLEEGRLGSFLKTDYYLIKQKEKGADIEKVFYFLIFVKK